MYQFIAENLGTLLIGAILLAVVALIIAKMVRDKKKGAAIGCGCSCKDCPSSSMCHR